MEDKGHIEIAKSMMKEIMYDNGMVNRWNPEKYPKKYVKMIAKSAGYFFDKHPDLLTDEVIQQMCCGFEEDNQRDFSHLDGYEQLDNDLNEYFDH